MHVHVIVACLSIHMGKAYRDKAIGDKTYNLYYLGENKLCKRYSLQNLSHKNLKLYHYSYPQNNTDDLDSS